MFLAAVTLLMCIENYWNAIALVVIVPALIGGWYAVRPRVLAVAMEREGFTGNYPVVAETPLQDEFLRNDLAKAAAAQKTEEAKKPESAD